tara:strand:- start:440 stop:646 length:207 start_codon:yes stop_codon:yes gene_type:complete
MPTVNIFSEPKELQKWAIKLANACGGTQVERTMILAKPKPDKIAMLMDRFVNDHNENTIAILNKLEEE